MCGWLFVSSNACFNHVIAEMLNNSKGKHLGKMEHKLRIKALVIDQRCLTFAAATKQAVHFCCKNTSSVISGALSQNCSSEVSGIMLACAPPLVIIPVKLKSILNKLGSTAQKNKKSSHCEILFQKI